MEVVLLRREDPHRREGYVESEVEPNYGAHQSTDRDSGTSHGVWPRWAQRLSRVIFPAIRASGSLPPRASSSPSRAPSRLQIDGLDGDIPVGPEDLEPTLLLAAE